MNSLYFTSLHFTLTDTAANTACCGRLGDLVGEAVELVGEESAMTFLWLTQVEYKKAWLG